MPRAARIDIPGILQHVIVRGIEKRDIFLDDDDRASFVRRFSLLLQETETECLAWALLSNHFHVLVRPKSEKLSTFMRRLLTGYAVTYNLRHCRTGHLFQNRYKSIVCEEDAYLLELVRYIHLNPLRAGLVTDVEALDTYPWTGHAVLLGGQTLAGQNDAEILALFGKRAKSAREAYRDFIRDGAGQGERKELVGGGLRRVQETGIDENPEAFDARILGSGEFVQGLLGGSEACQQAVPVIPLPLLVRKVAEVFDLTAGEVRAPGRSKRVSEARSAVSFLAYRKMGYSGEEVARELGITRSGVCRRAAFGEHLVRGNDRLRVFFVEEVNKSPASPR
jgi:REP element-mobilizing transposase RayT